MKKNYFIIIIFAIIISFIIGIQFFTKSVKKQITQTPMLSERVSFNNKLEKQINSDGQVTVSIIPRKSLSAGILEFEITLDTHSVELDEDLTKVAVLIADNKEYRPISWEGEPPGGHHRKGILIFAPISPQPKSINLKIRQIGGIKERNFIWTLH